MASTSNLPSELLAVVQQWIASELALVARLAPELAITQSPESLQEEVNAMLQEHLQLQDFLAQAFMDPEQVKSHPYVQLLVKHKTEHPDQTVAFTAAKRLGHEAPTGGIDTEGALGTILLVGSLTSPVGRWLLRRADYKYHYQEFKQVYKKSQIITN